MTAADLTLAALWIGLTLYALLAGADFGGGIWDLFAGRTHRGMDQRRLIETSIGPVWEANHVWLIFVLVVLWTTFPPVFAAVMSTLYVPLTLAALGIIGRGAAFAFRGAVTALWQQRLFGAVFALSSLLTPFFLGTVAGGIASGRVPPGIAAGDLLGSWLNPTSILGGFLAVAGCAYLAAGYLCADARRAGRPELVRVFRVRAIAAGLVAGALALGGIFVLRADAPAFYAGFTHRALAAVALSAAAGVVSLVLLWLRRFYTLVPVPAAMAVAAILWGWALAQYPLMLPPHLTVGRAAADPAVLSAVLIVILVGVVLIAPSILWLFSLFVLRRRP